MFIPITHGQIGSKIDFTTARVDLYVREVKRQNRSFKVSMSKDNFVRELIGRGYDARLEDGVVEVEIVSNSQINEIRAIMDEVGYNASWGTRYKSDIT